MTDTAPLQEFPKSITLASGAELELKLISDGDAEAMLKFAQALPQEDLLFLRMDISQPEVVDEWIQRIVDGDTCAIAAWDDSGLVGYAAVHSLAAPWMRGLGEIRVNIAPQYRGMGLGRVLTANIFDIANALGYRKLTAQMTADQKGAQAAFRKIGFIPEALLADYVLDRDGNSRDLVIMSYDVAGHSDTVAEPLRIG